MYRLAALPFYTTIAFTARSPLVSFYALMLRRARLSGLLKLAPDQLHASPLYADGKLYVPMHDGKAFVVKPHNDLGEILNEADMGAVCLAAPSAYDGKVYIQTKEALHCFGSEKGKFVGIKQTNVRIEDKTISDLQILPAEFALMRGHSTEFTVWGLNSGAAY